MSELGVQLGILSDIEQRLLDDRGIRVAQHHLRVMRFHAGQPPASPATDLASSENRRS